MKLNPSIFKAYDIRGIYSEDFDEEFAYQLGLAFVALRLDDGVDLSGMTIAVGADMRISSPLLKEKLISGIIDAGADVIDIGLVSTPAFYFAVSKNGCAGGIMVSASHNPGIWNGFKLTRQKAVPVSGDSGIEWLKEKISAGGLIAIPEKGNVREVRDIASSQMAHDLDYIDTSRIKPFNITADTSNGMGIQYLKELEKHLPCSFKFINEELDGSFPNHEADPLKDENMKQIQNAVIANGSDLGIATDGDGDRIFFTDNLGNTISPAIVRGLLAKIFLHEEPGAKIGYDIRPGKITEDLILENGGYPEVTRVGHSLIKEQMLKDGLFFAGESSGHFFLNLPIGCFEMPCIMISKLLEEFSASQGTVAEQVAPLYKYFQSGEINSDVKDKEAVIRALSEKYADGKANFLDGISVSYPDYWFNVRGSNTENKMRLNLEGISPEIVASKTSEILDIIRSY